METTLEKVAGPVFVEFPKILRLSRDVVVTEKIDGTNACVHIEVLPDAPDNLTHLPIVAILGNYAIYAGSRTRWITPGKSTDNFGFAQWVKDHAEELVTLGAGTHYGEWWGQGIQRGYGLTEKRFSLFNVARWNEAGREPFETKSGDPRLPAKLSDVAPLCCRVVPVIYRDTFESFMGHSEDILQNMAQYGSSAAPGFMRPEGIVAFHTASGQLFKKTLEKDEAPKGRTT